MDFSSRILVLSGRCRRRRCRSARSLTPKIYTHYSLANANNTNRTLGLVAASYASSSNMGRKIVRWPTIRQRQNFIRALAAAVSWIRFSSLLAIRISSLAYPFARPACERVKSVRRFVLYSLPVGPAGGPVPL